MSFLILSSVFKSWNLVIVDFVYSKTYFMNFEVRFLSICLRRLPVCTHVNSLLIVVSLSLSNTFCAFFRVKAFCPPKAEAQL